MGLIVYLKIHLKLIFKINNTTFRLGKSMLLLAISMICALLIPKCTQKPTLGYTVTIMFVLRTREVK